MKKKAKFGRGIYPSKTYGHPWLINPYLGVPYNGGTQQPWVFLLKMIILGCVWGYHHLRKHPSVGTQIQQSSSRPQLRRCASKNIFENTSEARAKMAWRTAGGFGGSLVAPVDSC